MRTHVGIVLVWCLSTVVVAEIVALAQAPPMPPTLVRPNRESTNPGFDISGRTLSVYLNTTAIGNTYKICVRDPGANSCYINVEVSKNSGMPMNDGSRKYNISTPIPANRQSTTSEWSARTCTGNYCGGFAPFKQFFVVPDAPNLTAPAPNAALSNTRTVTYSWTANQAANAGFQLYVLTRPPEEIGFNLYRPDAFLPIPSESVFIPAGTTSRTLEMTPGQTVIRWSVASCANFQVGNQNPKRRCSDVIPSPRLLTAPAFFGFAIWPTFRHDRCVNCHAVAADNFQNDLPPPPPGQRLPPENQAGGLPGGHPSVNAKSNCAICHNNGLLPTQGSVNPGWHAAPAALDFRNRTIPLLCGFARTGVGGATTANAVRDHLTQDKLILWAVGDGRVPTTPTTTVRPTAPPDSNPPNTGQEIQAWRQLVNRWVDAGMPCD
jgi:hypothetical protein